MSFLGYNDVCSQLHIRQNLRNILQRTLGNIKNERHRCMSCTAICHSVLEIQVHISNIMIRLNDQYRIELAQLEKEIIEAQITNGSGSTNAFLERFKKEKEIVEKKTAELIEDINQGMINQKLIRVKIQFFNFSFDHSIPSAEEQYQIESDIAQLSVEIDQLTRQKEVIERRRRFNDEPYVTYPEE